jgi:hypothetical protein
MIEFPKATKKNVYLIVGILILIGIGAAGFFLFLLPGDKQDPSAGSSSTQPNSVENQTDPVMPLFRVTQNPGDIVNFDNWSATSQQADAPLPAECPSYAEKALEPYGGIPPDATLDSVRDDMHGCIHEKSEVKCYAVSRSLVYRQKPYNVTIYGQKGSMSIALSAGGLPNSIKKNWLTLRETGITPIIPASEAMVRLRQGEGKNIPPGPLDLTILTVEPGYYVPENITNVSYLEPVWVITAKDEIKKNTLTLFIPAGKTIPDEEINPESGPGNFQNFTEAGRILPRPDIAGVSHVLIGTSGPVGEDAARESIRKFTANPGISLHYRGQSSKQRDGCGGQNYNWVYYDFTSGGCEFYVDTWTGTVIFAKTDPGCTNIGIQDLPSVAANSPDNAAEKVGAFIQGRYPQYDKRHVVLQYRYTPDSHHTDIEYYFTGTDVNIEARFDPADGHLIQYAAYNSNLVGKCASNFGIVVFSIMVIVLLNRRR